MDSGAKATANVTRRRIFISSPGDLQLERDALAIAIAESQRVPEIERRFHLICCRYEDRTPPIVGGGTPQEIVDYFTGRVTDAHVLVCVFGDRLGTPVIDTRSTPGTPVSYASGTAYELQKALAADQERRPNILLYRRRERPDTNPADRKEVDDYLAWLFEPVSDDRLDELERRFGPRAKRYEALYKQVEFSDAEELARLFRGHLGDLLDRDEARPEASESRHLSADERLVVETRRNVFQVWADASTDLRPIPTTIEIDPNPLDDEHTPRRADTCELAWQMPRLQKLLLTGEPDTGKSYALEHVLATLAETPDPTTRQQIPVIVNLSSWDESQDFGRWVIRELDRFYGIQQRRSARLIKSGRFLFLFDGLDEVGYDRHAESLEETGSITTQVACLIAMREFFGDGYDQTTRLVIACRRATAEAIDARFDLAGCFRDIRRARVLPIDERQISAYLDRDADPALAPLRERVATDPVYRDLARVPYMLAAMAEVYRPDPNGSVPWGGQLGVERRTANVLQQLEKQRFTELAVAGDEVSVFRRVLRWVARRVVRTNLLVEALEPDDIRPHHRGVYRALAALFLALAVGVTAALALGVSALFEWTYLDRSATFSFDIPRGARHAAANGAIAFLAGTLGSWPIFAFARGLWFGVLMGVVFAAIRGLMIGLTPAFPGGEPPSGLEAGIDVGIKTAVIALLPFALYGHYERFDVMRIRPLASFNWHWSRLAMPVVLSAGVGLSFLYLASSARAFAFGIMCLAIFGSKFAMARTGILVPPQPNWGIIRSFRTALYGSMLLTAIALVVVPTAYYLDTTFEHPLVVAGGNAGLSLTVLFSFLLFGGVPFLQHAALRIVLVWFGYAPLRLVRFLNLAVLVGPLRRVGGAYSFRANCVQRYYRSRD